MNEMYMPELIWNEAHRGLPQRMLPALKRWVTLGTFGGGEGERFSRGTGARV